jgi:hypothetical protein
MVSITVRHPTRKIDRSTIPKCVRGYAVGRNFHLPLVCIDRGIKISAEYYKKEFLHRILPPEAQKLYGDEYYCFQQDGAPSHTANIVQR